jgi:hypothetical protein
MENQDKEDLIDHQRMAVLDFTAAMAMQGIIEGGRISQALIPKIAYDYADAMVKEREKHIIYRKKD